jgi:hypothetical protein
MGSHHCLLGGPPSIIGWLHICGCKPLTFIIILNLVKRLLSVRISRVSYMNLLFECSGRGGNCGDISYFLFPPIMNNLTTM